MSVRYIRDVKILIVTAFYPPENTIGAQRPLSWAQAWSAAGHNVTVLTVSREKTDSISNIANVPMVNVIAVPPGGVFGLLRRLYRAVKNKPEQISDSEEASRAIRNPGDSIFARLKTRGLLSSVRWPDVYDFWVEPALKRISDEKFDVVVSTFGPPATLAIGAKLKKRGQATKWVADFRDLWTDNPSFRGFPVIRWFERWRENQYLKDADWVTTVSEPLAQTLRMRRQNIVVFTNGFEGYLETDSASHLETKSAEKVIRYTGSLYWPHQDPSPLLRVLKRRLQKGRRNVRVEFYGPNLSKIEKLIEALGVSEIARVFPKVTRESALKLQREADALLFLESPKTAGREGILTGKIFEYLATKRPILAIGFGLDSESGVGQIIAECDAGKAVDQDEVLIETFVEELDRLSLSHRPRGLPQRFERKTIALEMLRMISQNDD